MILLVLAWVIVGSFVLAGIGFLCLLLVSLISEDPKGALQTAVVMACAGAFCWAVYYLAGAYA